MGLQDSLISHALVACAELTFPLARCERICELMPSIQKWAESLDHRRSATVSSELFRYVHASGLYEAGGVSSLELPTSRWPVVLEDTAESLAEDCILNAANSLASIGDESFFGSASQCIDNAERCFQLCGNLGRGSLKEQLIENLKRRNFEV